MTTLHRLGSAESDASYSDAWHILAAFDPVAQGDHYSRIAGPDFLGPLDFAGAEALRRSCRRSRVAQKCREEMHAGQILRQLRANARGFDQRPPKLRQKDRRFKESK